MTLGEALIGAVAAGAIVLVFLQSAAAAKQRLELERPAEGDRKASGPRG